MPIRFSIITATYNSAATLPTAIESVLGQTYPHIEYIVVDGASTDGTQAIVQAYGTRIARFVSEPDGGIYPALNKGIAMATGDYVGFLHADDLLASPTIIAQMAQLATDHASDMVYGDLEYVGKENLNQTIRYWKSTPFEASLLKKGWMPPHPTLYVKRDWYQQIGGFDETFRIAADYDFVLRLFSQPEIHADYLNEVIVKMRVGGASNKSIKNIVRKSTEDLRAMRKNQLGGVMTLFRKNVSKLGQFFAKKSLN